MDIGYEPHFGSDKRRSDSLDKIKIAARRLFIERGYHATRPQDIAREAGLGHGTFYLHYADKCACFLAFIDDARNELSAHIRGRAAACMTLEQLVAVTFEAICEYADANPGVADAAMMDEAMVGAASLPGGPVVRQWGSDLTDFIRERVRQGAMAEVAAPEILGQAIAGALHQCWHEGKRSSLPQHQIATELVRFVSSGVGP